MNTDSPAGVAPRPWLKTTRARTWVFLAVGLLLGALITFYWSDDGSVFRRKPFVSPTGGLLVLEDCDSDFRTPPFEDAVITFGANGKPVRKVTGLNICETVGGCRALSVSKDGRFFTVCETVGNKLTVYQLNTGERLWSLDGEFTAASVSQNGVIYALTSAGTIYGNQLLQIDQQGRIMRQAVVGAFDLAIDDERKVVWLVGKNIKKCDLASTVLFEINCIGWCAVSVDLARDGSVWVAEREHPQVAGSTNRIIQISPQGKTLNVVGLPFTPFCLRADRDDGSVWVTGVRVQESAARRLLDAIETRTGRLPIGKKLREFLIRPHVWANTRKYDQNGALLCDIPRGGFSLDIDQVDGSLWIGGKETVYHCSRKGAILGQSRGVASDQKYVAVVPGHDQHKEGVPPNRR